MLLLELPCILLLFLFVFKFYMISTCRHGLLCMLTRGKNINTIGAMSNPNGLLSQKVCHRLNQGRTLNDILMRAAYWMAYFNLSKLNVA